MQNTVIILGGAGGSGRSTIAKQLEERFGFSRTYGGLRQVIKKLNYKNVDSAVSDEILVDFQKNYLPNHPEIDLELDAKILSFASNTSGNVVIESMTLGPITKRLELPYIRVWVDASEEVRLSRLLNRHNDKNLTKSELKKVLEKRTQDNRRRYEALYGFDFLNYQKYYEVVFNTENVKLEAMAEKLLDLLDERGLISKDE